MSVYKFSPDGFGVIKKNLLKKCLGTSLAVVVLVPLLTLWALRVRPAFAVTMVILLLIFSIGNYFRNIKLQYRGVSSYELLLHGDVLIRRQAELPEVRIHRKEIKGIHETAGVGMLVATEDYYKYIFIPELIEHYDEVRDELMKWKEIESMPDRRIINKPLLTGAIFSASFMTTILAKDIALFLPAGLLLISVPVFTMFELHIKKDVESRAARKRFVMYALVLSVSLLVLRLLDWFNIT